MREKEHIFCSDVKIPEIVMQKAETAFREIKMEDEGIMKHNKKANLMHNKKRKVWRSQAAAAACVCLIAAGGISAVAAVHHFWSPGMKGTIQATEEQQQVLTDQGVASVLSEIDSYENMAVTDGNVTVTPETVIADDKFAYISFSVKGYSIEENAEPGFDKVNVYLGDDPNVEQSCVNMSASFYDGIVSSETGGPVYDDGSSVEYSDDGATISHYVNQDGSMEYVIQMSVVNENDSLLGETVHIELKDLGVLVKAECDVALEGEWNFALNLPSVSSATNITIGKSVPDTVFELDSMEMSPVSVKLNYSVNGEVEIDQDDNGVPEFCGIVMKDGTRYPYLGNGGMTGYTDDTMKTAYVLSTFDRVIEVDQVMSLLMRTTPGADFVEIPVK